MQSGACLGDPHAAQFVNRKDKHWDLSENKFNNGLALFSDWERGLFVNHATDECDTSRIQCVTYM